MTLFDYLVIGFGLLFTGAAMRLIGGLSSALNPERRYWIPRLTFQVAQFSEARSIGMLSFLHSNL